MTITTPFVLLISCVAATAQVISDQELPNRLANEATRRAAVDLIVASGMDKLPLLLSWTRNPPADINENELYVGLADAFGRLRAKEAIPFLIKNISIQRWHDVNTWLKTPSVIEERLPAVAALIQIGPEASKALIRASWEAMVAEDRLAAIFVISQVKGVPEARAFLSSALAEASLERYWAEEGLKRIDEQR
jgi:hypothetical protein